MKKPIWLSLTVTLLAGSGLVPCHGEAASSIRADDARPAASLGTPQIRSAARLLSGDGWESTIVLMDLGATPVSFRESFLGNNGSPTPFNVILPDTAAPLNTSALQGVIGPYGSLSFTLQEEGASLQEAWSLLTFDGLPNQLGGYVVLRHRAPGGSPSFESTLPLGNLLDASARMPFDNTQGFQTQLTIVNPATNLAAQVQLTYFNSQGQPILLDSQTLNPSQQTTLTLPDTYPDLANQAGSIAILASINCLSVSGLRVNPASGAISAVPVMDFAPSIMLQ